MLQIDALAEARLAPAREEVQVDPEEEDEGAISAAQCDPVAHQA